MHERFLLMFSLLVSGTTFVVLSPSQRGFLNKRLLVSAGSLRKTVGQKSPAVIDARTSGYETAHVPGARHPEFGNFSTGGTGLLRVVGLSKKLSAAIRSNTQSLATPRLSGIRTRHITSSMREKSTKRERCERVASETVLFEMNWRPSSC